MPLTSPHVRGVDPHRGVQGAPHLVHPLLGAARGVAGDTPRTLRSRSSTHLAAVLGRVEGNFLTFHEAAHAGALESGGMDEHVVAAVVGLDEAEAFLIVVELYGARIHGSILSLCQCT